jgi:hypothetical protein
MKRDKLEQLSDENLIDLIQTQQEQFAQLQEAFEQLKAEYQALLYKFDQRKPPPTSKISSQPPTRDQKSLRPKNRGRRGFTKSR